MTILAFIWLRLTNSSATSDVIETAAIEGTGLSEEVERDDDRVLLTSVLVARDVNQRPIHTLRAVTTVPESERTAIPAAEKTVNGTEVIAGTGESAESVASVEIAADAISMTDLDETYLTNDPDVAAVMTAETVETRIVVVTEGVEEEDQEEEELLLELLLAATAVEDEALHHHAGKSPLQI